MTEPHHDFIFSRGHSNDGNYFVSKHLDPRAADELRSYIEKLQKANAELLEARRAALNLMEDAILSREEVRQSEEKYRQKLEQEVLERTEQLRQAQERVMELNKTLLTMNRELNSLNSELKTFTSVAATNYSETLRQLYINLELIMTHDAPNFSNSGRANLRRAQAAIQRLKLVTDDLVSFSKLQHSEEQKNPVDLNDILKNAINEVLAQSNHPFIEISCAHLPVINGHGSLLSLMFHHLLDNAVKFRKEGQSNKIDITCREVAAHELQRPSSEKVNNYFVVSIRDSGIGFPQHEAEKLFEMFYRLHEKGKYKGSGIGLSIAKKIMEMHSGFITAEGEEGNGASFHCYFPVV